MMTWISYSQAFPARYARKADIPKPWQHWAKRVKFNFEIAWIVLDENSLVYMPDDNWTPCSEFYLKTPGHVIGLRDLITADGRDWSIEWRTAFTDAILDSLNLSPPSADSLVDDD